MTKDAQIKTAKRLRKSKAERDAYVTSQINVGIPFQIRALRKQRQWDQKTLAEKSGMAQPRISAMEGVSYGTLNLKTLKRLASAFDVGLMVRFVPFGELIEWEERFSPDTFSIPSINEEHLSGDDLPKDVLQFPKTITSVDGANQVPTTSSSYAFNEPTEGYAISTQLTGAGVEHAR